MPYIDEKTKQLLQMTELEFHGPHTTGELTYLIQQAIQEYLLFKLHQRELTDPNHLRYADVAEVLGSLEGARADVIRRILTPLEERAQDMNGDVWSFEILEGAGYYYPFDRPVLKEPEFTKDGEWMDPDVEAVTPERPPSMDESYHWCTAAGMWIR